MVAFVPFILGMTALDSGKLPLAIPETRESPFSEFGFWQAGYRYRKEPEWRAPLSTDEGLDVSGATCTPVGVVNGKEAVLMHPAYSLRAGITFQEFRLKFPAGRATISGFTALDHGAVGKSDGVTFRVLVNGVVAYKTVQKDENWRPFTVNVDAKSDEEYLVRFETDPGPADNTSYDWALWGDRKLTIARMATAPLRPSPPPLDLARLVSRLNGEVAPIDGDDGTSHLEFHAHQALFTYEGASGTLRYSWRPEDAPETLVGHVSLAAQMRDQAETQTPISSGTIGWVNPAKLISSEFKQTEKGAQFTRKFIVDKQETTLTVEAILKGKSLVFEVQCDRPVIGEIRGGNWGPVMQQRLIPTPYCSLSPTYLPHENLFVNSYLDWTRSEASSQSRAKAVYEPLTNGKRNLVRERLIYAAAWRIDETLPNIPNPPSLYQKDLADRIVLDIWQQPFSLIEEKLKRLGEYGLGPAVALIHNWQRSGYDNALPAHVPANEAAGGDPAMKSLVATGKRLGIRMALHENYVDYYPNYEGFSDHDIVRQPNGERENAWFNPGTKIQSFAIKPTRILPLAESQSPQIKRRYDSDACYLDVHSAVPPWFHVDADYTEKGAGKFKTVWDAHTKLWTYERDVFNGPVFGEGANHWFWSGYLDGVEAQFGAGWSSNAGTTAPLFADFDLLRIRPLQLNHGMGYYERWLPTGDTIEDRLDQYRGQEIAFGHQGFLGGDLWMNPALACEEARLIVPVTQATNGVTIRSIDYWVDGAWHDATVAAKAQDFSCVRIGYANGVRVYVNGSSSIASGVDHHYLPPGGWAVDGPGLRVATELIDGKIADVAITPRSVFVNSRPPNWAEDDVVHIKPSLMGFRAIDRRSFEITYRWDVSEPLAHDEKCFVHFISADGKIAFQQDHALAKPTSLWRKGDFIFDGPYTIHVPDALPEGDYEIAIGLWDGLGRVRLEGRKDSERRVIIGKIHVGNESIPYLHGAFIHTLRGSGPVNFGDVVTNGAVAIDLVGGEWIMRPLIRKDAFVELKSTKFGSPAVVVSSNGARIKPQPRDGKWRIELDGSAEYRWRP